jgi:hypothetical protein
MAEENYYAKRQKRFEFKVDPQNGCLIGPDDCHYETEAEAMYYGQLKFCGCGEPKHVHAFTIECLKTFDIEHPRPVGAIDAIAALVTADPEAAAYFIAYTLDQLCLTEHGGSVGGAWLTDRGKQFVEIGPRVENDDANSSE